MRGQVWSTCYWLLATVHNWITLSTWSWVRRTVIDYFRTRGIILNVSASHTIMTLRCWLIKLLYNHNRPFMLLRTARDYDIQTFIMCSSSSWARPWIMSLLRVDIWAWVPGRRGAPGPPSSLCRCPRSRPPSHAPQPRTVSRTGYRDRVLSPREGKIFQNSALFHSNLKSLNKLTNIRSRRVSPGLGERPPGGQMQLSDTRVHVCGQYRGHDASQCGGCGHSASSELNYLIILTWYFWILMKAFTSLVTWENIMTCFMMTGCMDRYGTWSWEHQALRPTFHWLLQLSHNNRLDRMCFCVNTSKHEH